MTFSDEAVEAAARAALANDSLRSLWRNADPEWRESYKSTLRAALTAAAPFIAAQAWDEGRDVAHAEMARMYSSQCEGDDCDCNEPITNPYRSEQ